MESGNLGYAIRSALAKDPEHRVEDATALLDILRGQTEVPRQADLWQSRWVMVGAVAFFLAALLVAGGLSYVLYQRLAGEPEPVVETPVVEAAADPSAGQGAARPAEVAPEVAAQAPGPEVADPGQEPSEEPQGAPDEAPGEEPGAEPIEEFTFDPDEGEEGQPEEAAPAVASARKTEPRKKEPRKKPQQPAATQVVEAAPPAEDKKPPREEARPAEAAPSRVSVSFTSEPAGAQVTVNGAPICTAPCSRSYDIEQTLRVRFSKIGYNAEVRTLGLKQGARSVRVKLRPGRIRLVP
jgi:hypothetical protein